MNKFFRIFTDAGSGLSKWMIAALTIITMATPASAQTRPPKSESDPKPIEKHDPQTIRFAIPQIFDSYLRRSAELLYTEAFRRLGFRFELYTFPMERALQEAEAGRMDGEVARIQFDEALAAQYPNLIQVPEPIFQMQIAAYTTDPAIHISGWEDFGYEKFMVGYPRGHKAAQRGLQSHVNKDRIFEFKDERQGLIMLQRGRLDVLVSARSIVDKVLSTAAFKKSGVVMAGVVDVSPLFPCLNIKRREMVPRLAMVLRAMKEDGTFEWLRRSAKADQAKDQ